MSRGPENGVSLPWKEVPWHTVKRLQSFTDDVGRLTLVRPLCYVTRSVCPGTGYHLPYVNLALSIHDVLSSDSPSPSCDHLRRLRRPPVPPEAPFSRQSVSVLPTSTSSLILLPYRVRLLSVSTSDRSVPLPVVPRCIGLVVSPPPPPGVPPSLSKVFRNLLCNYLARK